MQFHIYKQTCIYNYQPGLKEMHVTSVKDSSPQIERYLKQIQYLSHFREYPARAQVVKSQQIDLQKLTISLEQAIQIYSQFVYLMYIAQKTSTPLYISSKVFVSKKYGFFALFSFNKNTISALKEIPICDFAVKIVEWHQKLIKCNIKDRDEEEKRQQILQWSELIIQISESLESWDQTEQMAMDPCQSSSSIQTLPSRNCIQSADLIKQLEKLKIFKNYVYNLKVMQGILIQVLIEDAEATYAFVQTVNYQKSLIQNVIDCNTSSNRDQFFKIFVNSIYGFLSVLNKKGKISLISTESSSEYLDQQRNDFASSSSSSDSEARIRKKMIELNVFLRENQNSKNSEGQMNDLTSIDPNFQIEEQISQKNYQMLINLFRKGMHCKCTFRFDAQKNFFQVNLVSNVLWNIDVMSFISIQKIWLQVKFQWGQYLTNYLHAELKYLNLDNIDLKYNKFQKEVYIEETVQLNHDYPSSSILIYLLDLKSMIFLLLQPIFETEFRKSYYSPTKINNNTELMIDVLSKKLFKITEIYLDLAAKLTKIGNRSYSSF